MWYFRKTNPFELLIDGKFVTLVGAGGKTSLAEYLAGEAVGRGKRVALTTTTKIWAKEPYMTIGGRGWQDSGERFLHVGKTVEGSKLTCLEPGEVALLGRDFDLVLIEGDGSKGLPLKYPADFEPVIPAFSDRVVVLAGLDALSGRLSEKVFRWPLLPEAAALSGNDPVSVDLFLRLLAPDAMMKDVDPGKCAVVLNKYDACMRRQDAFDIARKLCERLDRAPVLVGSVKLSCFYSIEHR
jgi:probable selenium-dependent hydroxylase accessory protein YqeC